MVVGLLYQRELGVLSRLRVGRPGCQRQQYQQRNQQEPGQEQSGGHCRQRIAVLAGGCWGCGAGVPAYQRRPPARPGSRRACQAPSSLAASSATYGGSIASMRSSP